MPVRIHQTAPPEHDHSFRRQTAVEQEVSDEVLTVLRQGLVHGALLHQCVSKAEQRKGDFRLTHGGRTYYIELKVERYPETLFLELMQMGLTPEPHFSASWAFTTTADFMLFISASTGQAVLARRAEFLEAGLRLAEMCLRRSTTQDKPLLVYATLNNSKDGRAEGYTNGAAGVPCKTLDIMTVCADLSRNSGRKLFALFEALDVVKRVKTRIQVGAVRKSWTAEQRAQLMWWANKAVDTTKRSTSMRDRLVRGYKKLIEEPETLELPPLSDTAEQLLTGAWATDGQQRPLTYEMPFLVRASLQCTYSSQEMRRGPATRSYALENPYPESPLTPHVGVHCRLRTPTPFGSSGPRPEYQKAWLEQLRNPDKALQQLEQAAYFEKVLASRKASAGIQPTAGVRMR